MRTRLPSGMPECKGAVLHIYKFCMWLGCEAQYLLGRTMPSVYVFCFCDGSMVPMHSSARVSQT
jgi:hypothetical protein